MASTLVAMASNLLAMASNLITAPHHCESFVSSLDGPALVAGQRRSVLAVLRPPWRWFSNLVEDLQES